MKNTFLLYTDICKGATSIMNDKQAGQLFRMIIEYAEHNSAQPCDDLGVNMAFEIIRAAIDSNNRSYEEICEKRRENGRKGAEVTNGKKRQKAANAEQVGKSQQMPNDTAKVGKNGKSRLYENKEPNGSYDILYNKKKSPKGDSQKETCVSFSPADFLKFFNDEMKKANALIPCIKSLSDQRKKSLGARIREYGKEALAEVIRKAAASDFLNGKNGRDFVATFDWLMKPTNFPKVLEGNYDNPVQKNEPKETITSNVNGLIEQVKKEQQQREEERRKRILETYQAAKNGDERSVQIIQQMRENGTLEKFNLK